MGRILRVTQQTTLYTLDNLKIAHLNIRASGQTLVKPQAIILHIVRKTADIMCFPEVKISKKNHNFFHHKDYNTYHNLPDNHLEQAPKGGLIILVRKTLCNNQPTITHINPGKATTILFKFPNLTLKCYCLYAPSEDDPTSLAFYEDLFDANPPDPTQNTIYIGDFNVVQNTTLDRRNHNIKYHKPKTHKYLTASMLDHALVDPWRTQYYNSDHAYNFTHSTNSTYSSNSTRSIYST